MRRVVTSSGDASFTVVREGGRAVEPVDRYLGHLASREASPNTVRAYAYDLAAYFSFLEVHNFEWTAPTSESIGWYVEHLRWPERIDGAIALRPVPRRSAASVNRTLAALASFYDFHRNLGLDIGEAHTALRSHRSSRKYKGFLSHLDCGGRRRATAIRLKSGRRTPRSLTSPEVMALLNACDHVRDRLFLACMIDAGLRVGEVLGLRHGDISPSRCEINVVARPNANGARAKSGDRVVPVSPQLILLYNDYLDLELGPLDTDYIFVRLWREPVGEPLSYDSAYDLAKRLRKKTGVHFVFHELRHTYATDLLRAGVTPEVVKELLGHSSVSTTSSTYAHLTVEDLRSALHAAARARSVVLS